MAIIASRKPYYITYNTTDLVVKIKTWNSDEVEPDYQHQVDKSTNGGVATDLTVDVSQYIRPYFTLVPQPNPTNITPILPTEWLNVKISVNDVEETHNAVYGYTAPIDEYYYDHWQTTKAIHSDTDAQLSLPPTVYTVTWTTDDGQVATENTTSIEYPHTARVANTNIDLTTANRLTISTPIIEYNYDIVCPHQAATIGFVNSTGMWEYFDVNGRQDTSYNREAEEYRKYSDGNKKMINVNGWIDVSFNTGWVDEEFRRVITDLMYSDEIIWMYGQTWASMILKTNSIRRQTKVNEKMLNYSFSCEIASLVIPPSGGQPSALIYDI